MINERDEPIVLVVEIIKAILKMREYRALVNHEKINVLVDMDVYRNFKASEAYEQSLLKLIRSNKTISKPPLYTLSSGLAEIRK